MNIAKSNLRLKDKGDCVTISIATLQQESDLHVYSTTTQLQIKDSAGKVLVDVPQLYSTVDASRTAETYKDGMLIVTLYKLSPNERWPSIEPEEITPQTMPRKQPAQAAGSEGAMEARNLVRQLFEAALHGRTEELEAIAPRVSTSGLNSVKDGNGRNALHFASQGGQIETARYLLEGEGITLDSQDDQGETPLGLAAGSGQGDVAKLLIDRGANIHLAKPSKPQPLHRAAAIGDSKIVGLLLEAGAEIDAPSESGTPLLWAAGSGSSEVVANLLAAGANPNAQTPDGVTAMLMAAASGNAAVIRELSRHNANASLPATGGVTALHAAAELGDCAVVEALLEAGADPNAMDADSEAKPIHAAACSGHAHVVEQLLPLTKPRKGEAWSVEALMADTSSAGTVPSPEQSNKAKKIPECDKYDPEVAASCKREGDEAFVKKEFMAAEAAYSKSLKHDTSNHLVWANRSAARFRQGKAELALEDARQSREIDPKYLKAWYREGEAARVLKLYEDAAQAFYEAYILDPSSSLIARDFQDAVAKGREQFAERSKENGRRQ